MEMITHSFPSNAFVQMDLNSICKDTSPAFAFNKEHLNGEEYAGYLTAVSDHFKINIQTDTEVQKVHQQDGGWVLTTNQGQYFANYLIWAAGEFQNPQLGNITGSEHCIHSSLIKQPDALEGDDFVIVGGYESGVQIAFNLIKNNKKVTIINPYKIDDKSTSDPSRVLSPYTYTKYDEIKKSSRYTEILGEVEQVTKQEHQLHLKNEAVIEAPQKPICATGFALVTGPIEAFITYRKDGTPLLNKETDEFLGYQNLYLSGPSVRHDNHIFCFIYKFRQRFGVIAEDILRKEGYDERDIAFLVNRWKTSGMYMADLSCCGDECVC